MENIRIGKEELLSELTRLNGGNKVTLAAKEFNTPLLPSDFEQWYAEIQNNIPDRKIIDQEIELGKKQLQLSRASSYPGIQTGYMSEKVIGEQFQGITLGITLPLWEKKNSVKYDRANLMALNSARDDIDFSIFQYLKLLYEKSVSLRQSLDDYKSEYQQLQQTGLLDKALAAGEINIIEYYLQISVYYENMDRMLEMKRDLNKTLAELFYFL